VSQDIPLTPERNNIHPPTATYSYLLGVYATGVCGVYHVTYPKHVSHWSALSSRPYQT